ncbi:restriction endonuclease subunit S [Salipiger abyssi]|uniref:Type I restriction enzyme, S subunit n=1 Tax=Salipiger abyssi TaxID=1250539 RepID=A0A1P8V176_9RHOB|nr:restriction endonuclease subunit S [Salipiger abyssi]APZ55377.1 type I restriction enzyme, S subunit [Salipiger abyssi]
MIPEAGLKTPLHRDDWTTTRLKYLLERKRRDLRPDDGVVTAFRDGVVTLRSNRREDGFTFADKEIGYQGVEPGDLVIHAMDGFAGAIGVSDSRGKCSPVYTITVPRPNAQAHTRFWAYYLRNLAVTGFIESLAKGIRERSTDFRWNDAGNLLVNFPDRDTQKAIADFLDRETARIDQLIEKKQRLVGLVKESEFAHIAQKFSQLDARTWRVRHLGKLRNGAGFPVDLQGDPSQAIAFFKVKHLKVHGLDAAITETTDTVSEETARSLRATVFPKGTIVFAKIGAALLLGRFSMLGRPACIDNNMSAFVPNASLIEPNFALLGLSQADMTTMVQPGAVPSLSTEAFYSFGIPLPPKEAQSKFVDEFRRWRATTVQIVGKTQQSIARLQEFRSALITAAVTGQIDVTTWGKQGQTDRRLDEIEEAMQA